MEIVTSKLALGIATGICGTLFLGYCIYFDYQRHNDPDFKKKLRERRRAAKKVSSKRVTVFPNMKDHDAVQRFFLQEIQLGEELLGAGDLEDGIEHMANAVAVCGNPNELLGLLRQTLQPEVFMLLIQRLSSIHSRIGRVNSGSAAQEDDVE